MLPFVLVFTTYAFFPRVIAAAPRTFVAAMAVTGVACSLSARLSVFAMAWRAVYAVVLYVILWWAMLICVSAFPQNYRLAFPRNVTEQQKAFYQATLRSYQEALPPGTTRKDVEAYLRRKNIPFRRICCMLQSHETTYADEVKIGEENTVLFCEANIVYVGFQFVAAGSPQPFAAHESDTLVSIQITQRGEGCL